MVIIKINLKNRVEDKLKSMINKKFSQYTNRSIDSRGD